MKRHFPSAFTLIELLVVVAIIGLLIAILIPALMLAQEAGNELICKTQLDQIYKAVFVFVEENDDNRIPAMGRGSGTAIDPFRWVAKTANVIGSIEDELYKCPSDQKPQKWLQLFKTQGGTTFFVSSERPGDIPTYVTPVIPISYRGTCDSVDPDIRAGRRITDYHQPATEFLLVEGAIVDTAFNCWRTDYMYPLAWPNAPSNVKRFDSWERHTGTTNVLFVDGHVDRGTPYKLGEMAIDQQYGGIPEEFRDWD